MSSVPSTPTTDGRAGRVSINHMNALPTATPVMIVMTISANFGCCAKSLVIYCAEGFAKLADKSA